MKLERVITMNRPRSLYIHIPFCKQKCFYCDFCSFAATEGEQSCYVDSLIKEIQLYHKALGRLSLKTIFIGGGTPSILSIHDMTRLVQTIHACFEVDDEVEFTMESNPGTVTMAKLKAYRGLGINRISMGLQATQNHLLKKLGRIHTFEIFLESYQLIRKAGFENVNIDLMYGLPDQTEAMWQETLEKVVGLEPEHLSAYSLKIEEGTPFDHMYEEGKLTVPSEEADRRNHHVAMSYLKEHGYEHYEISNFSKPGYRCAHNLVYWHNAHYIGVGLGAHGYLGSVRYGNVLDLESYSQLLNNDKWPRASEETIGVKDAMFETIMLELRLMEGLSLLAFKERFGYYLYDLVGDEVKKCIAEGLLVECSGRLCLTEFGMDISNAVLVRILEEFENNTRAY